MDNVLSSGVCPGHGSESAAGGPDTASMCRDEETPDYNAPAPPDRARWIFPRVSTGTIMPIPASPR